MFASHPCFDNSGATGITTQGLSRREARNRAASQGKPVYRGTVSKQCEHCGGAFSVRGSRYYITHFCSRSCYVEGRTSDPVSRLKYKVDESGCWVWQRYLDPHGYGRVGSRQNALRAYVVSYEAIKDPVPPGLHLDHLCRNRACINPDHLEPVTPRENCRRGQSLTVLNSQKTHCSRGHAFQGSNVRIDAKGYRFCRACDCIRAKDSRRRRAVKQKIACTEA